MSDAGYQSGERAERFRRKDSPLIAVIVVLGICLAVVAMYVFAAWHANTVVTSNPAGEVLNAKFDTGLIVRTTTVETSRGVFQLRGTLQITKGTHMNLVRRMSGNNYLCEDKSQVCHDLVGN